MTEGGKRTMNMFSKFKPERLRSDKGGIKLNKDLPTTFGFLARNSEPFREALSQMKKVEVLKMEGPREVARGRYDGHKFFKLKVN
jgi:hypothetical protein